MIKTARTFSQRIMNCLVLLLALSLLYGCGAVNKASLPSTQSSPNRSIGAVFVSISPQKAALQAGNSLQFTATEFGPANEHAGNSLQFTPTAFEPANTDVEWLVNGVPGGNSASGTISRSGLYTAPQQVTSNAVIAVAAISKTDPTKASSAAVTVVPGPALIKVSVSPSRASLYPSQVQQFAATIVGTTNQGNRWFANDIGGGNSTVGTISSTGVYTAPQTVPAVSSITITARSTYDIAASATATVTVMGSPAPPTNAGTANNAYYVDASAGKDSNDGRSPTTAWRTIAKVNASSFSAGDQVLFKRGEVWREQLTVPSSGSAGKPIIFGAYSSGVAPAIAGSDEVTGWIADAGSGTRPSIPKVYSATSSFMPEALFRNGVKLGTAKSALNGLNSDDDWYDDGASIYLYSSHDPLADLLEATNRSRSYGIHVAGKSYVTIQNLQVRQASAFNVETNASTWIVYSGIESLQAQSSGFNIENGCNFVTIGGGSLIHDNGFAELGDRNGIGIGSLGNGSSNITVQDSDIYHNANHNIEVARTNSNAFMANLNFQRNRIHNGLAAGIYVGGAHTGVSVIYNQIYSNAHQGLILAEGTGEPNPGGPVIVVYNNIIWGNGSSGGTTNDNVVLPSNSTFGSTTFKNNIVAEANGQEIQVLYGAAYSGDNNLFYHSAGGTFLAWHGMPLNLAQWKANSLQDTHSVDFDPRLKNAAGGDFTLTLGSPAMDAGANLGSPYNWALDPRTSFPWSTVDQNTFGSWAIGPFVYLP